MFMGRFRNTIKRICTKFSLFIRQIKLIRNQYIKILNKKLSVTKILIRTLKI